MKIKKQKIPADSLIANYLPADYSETYETVVAKNDRLTPDNILISSWTDFPVWVRFLFRFRDALVKPFGLKGGDVNNKQTFEYLFKEMVRTGGNYNMMSVSAKSGNETVLKLSDKHLTTELSCHIEDLPDRQMKISIITLVHYHNALGKIYFTFIKPFHIIIVKTIMKRSIVNIK
jgi:hypothetical protein